MIIHKNSSVIKSLENIEKQFDNEIFDFTNAKELVVMQTRYEAAIREISTKLENLVSEFESNNKRNPIHHMEGRLKSTFSIVEKLIRKGIKPSPRAAVENLTDIAGVRVICNYVEDIYRIVDLLCEQDDISVVRVRDYIENPKPNGYRSLHVIVTVPVFLTGGKQIVPVEIQVRTIAMDFWASLEHQIYYKCGNDLDISESLVERLKACADNIYDIDVEMQKINSEIQEIKDDKEKNIE